MISSRFSFVQYLTCDRSDQSWIKGRRQDRNRARSSQHPPLQQSVVLPEDQLTELSSQHQLFYYFLKIKTLVEKHCFSLVTGF